ncbi:hypothetical protein LIER_24732 [Lithospermum erythrorhizon]|uniref:Putative plant transposon protein domain-containing protein n=1 Tax=Lithospermum erythrorhizon TaxID=34254 RepID=A0AAV3P399_LITER
MKGGQTSKSRNLMGETTTREPVPLQVIPPQAGQHETTPEPFPPQLSWKENMGLDEHNSEHDEQFQAEESATDGGMGMHVPPSTETLISRTGGNKEDVNVDPQKVEVENVVGEEKHDDLKKMSGDVEGIKPNVKNTSVETSYKFAKTHSSAEPTVAEILVGLKNVRVVAARGGRENQDEDDDVVMVSYTTSQSRRRTRAYVVALEKKRVALGARGDDSGSIKPEEAVDVEELERLGEKKRVAKKGKGKAKRPSGDEPRGSVPKRIHGVVISEPEQVIGGDKFVIDDVEISKDEDAAGGTRSRSKGKLNINDNRNRINNRRIAKDVEDVSTEGVDFSARENEARWKFVCARNILPERYMSKVTIKNQTYMDIMEESGMLAIVGDIGPYWPSLVREFICNLSEDIVDPSNSMFHKVKVKGLMFDFSPVLINHHYGRQNEGITRSTLKLADIIKILTGGALLTWPTKGQLQASTLSLRYVMMHKVAIANLVPTSNNTNVIEVVGMMMYVMGSERELDFRRLIFEQIVDHSRTGANLKPIGFPSLICSILIHQHLEVLKADNGPREDAKSLTITNKLMIGKHLVDVQIKGVGQSDVAPEWEAAALLIKAYEEEEQRLDVEILLKKGRVSQLQEKI